MQGYTLLLDEDWDITLDEAGNIATAQGAYAIAQNVANAVRLFVNDAYFAQNKGIPHFNIELGQKESVAQSVLVTRLKKAALSIEGVINADVSLSVEEEKKRVLGGKIKITLENGQMVVVEI